MKELDIYLSLFWALNAFKIHLFLRQVNLLAHTENVPAEVASVMTQDDFVKSKNNMGGLYMASIIGIVLRGIIKTVKLRHKYPGALYEEYASPQETPLNNLLWYTASEAIYSKLLLIPVSMIVAAGGRTFNDPLMTLTSVFFASAAQVSMYTLMAVGATYVFASLTDRYGIRTVLIACPIINMAIVAFVTLYVHFCVPFLYPVIPSGGLRSSVSSVCEKVGFPMSNIFMIPNELARASDRPNAYYTGIFGAKTIFVSESLTQLLTVEEVTAVVAHELGHWVNAHTLLYFLMSSVQSLVFCAVAMFSYDQEWILEAFGIKFDRPIHQTLSTILTLTYCYPTVREIFTGLNCIVARNCEYAADRFAQSHGYSRPLCSALVKLSKNGGLPLQDSWFSSWFVGHPCIIDRIRHLTR